MHRTILVPGEALLLKPDTTRYHDDSPFVRATVPRLSRGDARIREGALPNGNYVICGDGNRG